MLFVGKKGSHDVSTQSANSQSDDAKMGFKGVFNSYSTSNENDKEPRYVNPPELLKQNPAFTMQDEVFENKHSNTDNEGESLYLAPAEVFNKKDTSDPNSLGMVGVDNPENLEFESPEEFHFEMKNVSTNQAANDLPKNIKISESQPRNDDVDNGEKLTSQNECLQNDSIAELDCGDLKPQTDIFDGIPDPKHEKPNQELKEDEFFCEENKELNLQNKSPDDLKDHIAFQPKNQNLKDIDRQQHDTVNNSGSPDSNSIEKPCENSVNQSFECPKEIEPIHSEDSPKEEPTYGNDTTQQPESDLKMPIHHGPQTAEHLNHHLNPLQETKSIQQKNKVNLPLKETSDKTAKSTQQPPKVLKFRPNDRNPDQQRVSYTTKEDIDSRGNFRKTLRENILQHKLSDAANDPEDDGMPPVSPVDRRELIPFRSKALSLSNGKTYSLAMTTVE